MYIHQYFGTPETIGAVRSYEFARRWVAQGHKITMLTSSLGVKPYLKESKGFLFKKLTIDGIDIVAVDIHYSQKMGTLRRIWAFLLFLILSSIYILFCKKPDVVYATSTPLTVGVPAIMAKWVRRIPYVFELRDQWPEIPIELGIIRHRIVKGVLLWLERTIYRYSSAIVALSPGMASGVREVLSSTQVPISVIPNCSDIDLFGPQIDDSVLREKYGWRDKFVFLYAGTIGMANGIDFLLDIAEKVRDEKNLHFVIIGKGREKQSLQKRAEQQELKNVEFIDFVPKAGLPQFVATCDVSMVIFANYPILEHNSANKFFDSLAAGKPVLLNYSGWQREVLEANDAGFGCTLCDKVEFVEKVLYLNLHRKKTLEMGYNARRVAVEKFPRDKLAIQALEVISNAKVECSGN